jgi:hypothetical protein
MPASGIKESTMKRARLSSVAWCVSVLAIVAASQKPQAVEPFNGKDLSGWQLKGDKARSHWKVGRASLDSADPGKFVVAEGSELINAAGGGVDIYSEHKHGDAVIEVELMVPKGSNSGIYVMGEYEVQVLDSWGVEKPGPGDIGAIYGAAPPRVNAAKKPGEWQKFLIDFRAPRFDAAGNKTANAKFVKVTLNGQVIHENVEVKAPTPSCLTGKEAPTGSLMFQGDHGPVAYRNIKITPVGEN